MEIWSAGRSKTWGKDLAGFSIHAEEVLEVDHFIKEELAKEDCKVKDGIPSLL